MAPASNSPENETRTTNPALKIFEFLKICEAKGGASDKVFQVFERAASIDARRQDRIWSAQPELTEFYNYLHRTFLEAIAVAQRVNPGNANSFLNPWAGAIQNLIGLQYASQTWGKTESWRNTGVLNALKLTGLHVDSVFDLEEVISEDTIAQLKDKSEVVADTIAAYDIDLSVKVDLLHKTATTRNALTLYEATSNRYLQDSVAMTVGDLILKRGGYDFSKDAPRHIDALKTLGELVYHILEELAKVNSIAQLTDAVRALLH